MHFWGPKGHAAWVHHLRAWHRSQPGEDLGHHKDGSNPEPKGGTTDHRCLAALSRFISCLKALVWFWLIDETLSANLVYQSDYEIGSTTPSDEAMEKIMTMMMAW
jgi:hypothetical protein